MGLLSQGMESLSLGSRGARRGTALPASKDSPKDTAPEGEEADTSTLDKDEGNILMALISQLRPGMDLTKIALPTFVLEPRSLLERITDFFSHPDLIFGIGNDPDARQRFFRVMTFYLSGWHIKPRGVKKPYNPILNEFFRCTYYYKDGSQGYYVAEQVSHHPPISAFFYVSPKNGILITGELKPKSKFLGNSAATIMEGEDRIRLLDRPEDGEYCISMPNTYARGILFGKMVLELGDLSTIKNESTNYSADVDFKTKGWISGGYNQIVGKVKGPGRSDLGEVTGMWSGAIDFTDKETGKKKTLFDAANASSVAKSVLPEPEQEENESRRLWSNLTQAIKLSDMNAAQAAKSAVEEHQRELRAQREANGEPAPQSRFFKPVGDKWMPRLDVDNLPKDVAQLEKEVRKFIFNGRVPGPSTAGSATPTRNMPAPVIEAPPVSPSPSMQSPMLAQSMQESPLGVAGAALAEPTPSQPIPAQPVPAQPVPAQPVPAQPVPAQPASAQPRAQTVPTQVAQQPPVAQSAPSRTIPTQVAQHPPVAQPPQRAQTVVQSPPQSSVPSQPGAQVPLPRIVPVQKAQH